MDEYTTPARFVPAAAANLTDDVFDNAQNRPTHVAFSRKFGSIWAPVTSLEFADEVSALAAGLIDSGIGVGDRIALMSGTSYEWMLCDYAIWSAGAVTVPIYETSSDEQVEWYLSDSGAKSVFVQTAEHEASVARVADRLTEAPKVWRMDPANLKTMSATGATARGQVADRRSLVTGESLATIVYTSGTTGRPKGCAITHGSLVAQAANVLLGDGVPLLFNETKSALLFLPLAHILARDIQICAVRSGARLGHTANIHNLAAELQLFRPAVVLSVPRVFEKIYNTAKHQAAAAGHARIFKAAEDTAIAYSRALTAGSPGLLLRARHALFDRLVYRKLRDAMGGRTEFAVSGGAPLGETLGHFFRGVGVNILEGYGMTETCAGSTLNLPTLQRIGTVGKPIPGCTIRIQPDGEILIKAPYVFRGYWQNEQATAEILSDNWCHTGDIGVLDDDGFLKITGRKKDLIVTAAGKNVAPAVLEDRLRAHWLISQCLVVGDGKPYIAVLITIDTDTFALWKKEHGKPMDATVQQLRDDPDLNLALQAAVDDANSAVSHAEAIKRFRVLPTDFTEAGGELTPTLKVRRDAVMTKLASEVALLYPESP